jgi:type II secretory pathway component GspD/PulD (secretin)
VFALKYADAKAVATVIKDVFSTTDSTRSNNQRSQMFNFGRGGGGPPGMGGDAGGGGSGSSGGRPGAGRVVATADERSNSLIVSAPDDLMTTIESMVTAMDTTVEDVTEVRVFKLRHSDPVEMADLLTSLFPDESKNSNNSGRAGMRFGGMGGPGMQMAAAVTSNGQSDRLLKQTRVVAVPDQRTSSVVVSASRDLMNQIGKMIEQLDENPAKKQKVFVYELKNADVQNAEEIVRNLFQGQNSRNTSSGQNSSALATREQQMQNQQSSGMNSGFGSGNGGGQQRLQ